MFDTPDPRGTPAIAAFEGAEISVLITAYELVLSYFDSAPPLDVYERNDLARLTLMAASTRRRVDKGLSSIVDAHALAAEIADVFVTLQDLHSKAPRVLSRL